MRTTSRWRRTSTSPCSTAPLKSKAFCARIAMTNSSSSARRVSAKLCSSKPSAFSISVRGGPYVFPWGPFSTSQLVIRFSAGNSSPFSWCLPFRGRRSGSRRSVWKHLGAVSGLKVGPGLASLIGDEQLQGVSDHFVRLLEFTPSELQRCGADTDGHLVPRIRAATSPVAIFIDGVDEYFNKHVEGPTSHPSVTGELYPKSPGTRTNRLPKREIGILLTE